MAVWPTYARVVVAGYGEEADYGVLRSGMDSGIAKQRARFSKPIVTRTATVIVMGLDNKQALDAWIDSDLVGGAAWFTWTEPLTGKSVQARLVGGKLKWGEPQGPVWQATCQIETLGR